MPDYKELCARVQKIVIDAGNFIRVEKTRFHARFDVESKGHSNFVTYVDKSAERMLVEALGQLIPGSGFIAEEGTSDVHGERFNWVIDPLDGTTNFIHGLPPHSVSVALMEGEEIVLGVVYEITLDELFYAWKGSAAYLNNREIFVSTASEHQEALIATGYPYYDFGLLEKYFLVLKEMMEKTSGVRRLGSAAADLCYVACGRFEAFWEYGLHPWDMAAAAFIVQQAGGRISDFNGEDHYLFNGDIIATNALYFDKFYEIVHQHMKH
ncbi:MAG TPA: inositol monophosphatase family protein [Prolixibacteraceae bacterium]|nr:inositol monophosphatase family protein [Prolixibacteraceae bacterium]